MPVAPSVQVISDPSAHRHRPQLVRTCRQQGTVTLIKNKDATRWLRPPPYKRHHSRTTRIVDCKGVKFACKLVHTPQFAALPELLEVLLCHLARTTRLGSPLCQRAESAEFELNVPDCEGLQVTSGAHLVDGEKAATQAYKRQARLPVSRAQLHAQACQARGACHCMMCFLAYFTR